MCIFVLIYTWECYSQGETNHWYFGWDSGIDFNSGNPVAVVGTIKTNEGGASISDANGNLLFYTNGLVVKDRNHNQMPNGFGLMGHSSASQSALIVRKPGSCTNYYIFTTSIIIGSLRYSEVDMSMNGGDGDIIAASKNILLMGGITEQLAGTMHSNGTDIWVITRTANNNNIYAYLVTSAGVAAPVMSSAGMAPSSSSLGYLKASRDGAFLVSTLSMQTGKLRSAP